MKKITTDGDQDPWNYKESLILFIVVCIIVLSSTPSQGQSYTQDSTKIAYNRLNEFAKFVEFKSKADSVISSLESGIKSLEIINKEKDTLLFNYEYKLIPNLTSQVNLQTAQIESKDQILNIREGYFKQERKRLRRGKLNWGVVGVGIGVIVGLFAF